jgi:hypothetical protein
MAKEKSNEERIGLLEKDVDFIKNKLTSLTEKQKLTLQEKFRLHDHMKQLEARFEAVITNDFEALSPNFIDSKALKELKDVVHYLCKLVDTALGVKFP